MKKKPLVISPKKYFHFLKAFGLNTCAKSGGWQENNVQIQGFGEHELGFIQMDIIDEDPIVFMDAPLFMETVNATENSLKVKLFQ
ncbi:hypothetical protein ACFL96_03915 [Thermoproteota archaeon]